MKEDNTTTYLAIAATIIVVAAAALGYQQIQLHHRQSMIHDRGSMVMPFNLSATTHVFNKTSTGGVQRITVDDAGNEADKQKIRSHMQSIADEFDNGNFSDPTALHGESMPGVDVLQAKHDELNVTYSKIDGGAKITYESQDNEVVNAVQKWFDAQLRDHGEDATNHA